MSGYPSHSSQSTGSMTGGPNYKWWVPASGINRQVITREIQSFLGQDALVKPGPGKEENRGINGYWISAYRNLTTAMLDDLKMKSAQFEKEQQAGGVASSRFSESHRDPRVGGLGPTPPLAHGNSIYPPPSTASPYTEAGYPPPSQGHGHPVHAYGAPGYSAASDPRDPYYQEYQQQQPPYGGQPQNVSPNTPQYANPHYAAGIAPPQHGNPAYANYPSPPQSGYPQQAYPHPSGAPRHGGHVSGGAYSQAQQPAYGYQTTGQSSSAYQGSHQSNGQYSRQYQ